MPKRILIAPLDWGLGHATRCVPLIHEFSNAGCEVIIAAEGAPAQLLQQEFPGLIILPLPGYHIQYSRRNLAFNLTKQIPKIYSAIRQEHRWLRHAVQKYNIRAVISDNRFGLHHPDIPSVFITHQLLIKTPFGNFADQILQKMNYHFIKKFHHCWAPDFAGDFNLAGNLSHPAILPPNTQYAGCFSRFEKKENINKKYDILVLLSGPEPQRTLLEKIILPQIIAANITALIISGRPEKIQTIYLSEKVQQVNHLEADALGDAIQAADIIISRSGYTTLMDLIKLQKKAIIIPTPGQTEQEYLGQRLMQQKIFYSVAQKNFLLEKALEEIQSFPFLLPDFSSQMSAYKEIIHSFAVSI